MSKIKLHSNRIVLPQGITKATIEFENGIITNIDDSGTTDIETEDLGNLVIMPGLIDSHVHINEPGRTDWEGFDTATKAAAAGGITTLVDMPLNSSPVTTTAEALQEKITAAKSNLHVNCGFWGGVVPENVNDLEPLINAGVLGIKAFLTHSGIDEFPNVTEQDLDLAMPRITKHNVPLLVHCELEVGVNPCEELIKAPTSYKAFLNSRPKSWENLAIELMIKLSDKHGTTTHIVHVSSDESLDMIKRAKERGVKITSETCPHYLCFSSEMIEDGNTKFKCAPPIREESNRLNLWKAIENGTIDFIVTDHSPAPPAIKSIEAGNFLEAWGGIASLQFSLPAIWTSGSKDGMEISCLSKLMSENISKFLNLENRKGIIKVGTDADLTIWNPEEQFTVESKNICYKHKISPFEGRKLNGVVKRTYVAGHLVYDNGIFNQHNKGNIILRKS